MSRRITQRELRNESGRIMRALDKGHSFTVTRNGVPVGELVPIRPRAFVAAESVAARLQGRATHRPYALSERCRCGDLPLYTRHPGDFTGLSQVLDIVAV